MRRQAHLSATNSVPSTSLRSHASPFRAYTLTNVGVPRMSTISASERRRLVRFSCAAAERSMASVDVMRPDESGGYRSWPVGLNATMSVKMWNRLLGSCGRGEDREWLA